MTTFHDILSAIRTDTTGEKHKGYQFEKLMQRWLKTDPRYINRFKNVWLWEEFPARRDFGGSDIGIDIVARTEDDNYWAVQCKCYKDDAVIDKPAVDSFITTSAKTFFDDATQQRVSFTHRLWISTTNHWGKNAEESIRDLDVPLSRISMADL